MHQGSYDTEFPVWTSKYSYFISDANTIFLLPTVFKIHAENYIQQNKFNKREMPQTWTSLRPSLGKNIINNF